MVIASLTMYSIFENIVSGHQIELSDQVGPVSFPFSNINLIFKKQFMWVAECLKLQAKCVFVKIFRSIPKFRFSN